ncbi:MAG: bifunctional oligoribonuclease/PAP phosphatase NrnA [Prevotellaceae bacterium]|jgi:phosphoesterase RecJ-like protein|nr:bifunctional oligoribonuclease/PAP phosphatase NrnA [Prevotellaceae bacterium]
MTQIFDRTLLDKLNALLKSIKKAVVITHVNPDGDAIGSSLGWAYYLCKNNIETTVITPNRFPEFLKWMEGSNDIKVYYDGRKQVEQIISEADAIFCLDFNTLNRIDDLGKYIESMNKPMILIDHHLEPASYFYLSFSYIPASSTAELVYRIIMELSGTKNIDTSAAEAIYAGIVTDTGMFSHSCANPELFIIVANLMECNIDKDKIHTLIYDNFTVDRMMLLGYSLNERMVVLPEYRTAYIYLTCVELDKYKFQPGDTEGFVNYPLSIKNIVLSAFFVEGVNHIKISFRSRGEFSVNKLAREHFNGGGHKNASGGRTLLTLNETVKLFETVLENYKDELLEN